MSYTETEVNKIQTQYFSSGWDAGIQHERERIIKLLEDKGTHPQCRNQPPLKLDGSIAWCKEGSEYCTMTLRQVGHIKGENK